MKNIFSPRTKAYLLGAGFGAGALIVQTELLRAVMEAAAGGALAVSAALGAWLFWIALGASASGLLARFIKSPEKAAFCCSILSLPLGLGLIYLAGVPRRWLEIGPGELIPFETLLAWSAAASAPFALLIGFSFPILARVAAGDDFFERENTPGTVGGLWAAEAAGALFSGLVFTLVLASNATPIFNVCLFASFPPLIGASSGIYRSRPGRILSIALVPAVLLTLISIPRLENHFLRLRWESLGSHGERKASQWTLYRHLLLAGLDNQTTLYDNGFPAYSFPDQYSDASFLSILLSQVPSCKRVLVVGPSAYGPAQAFLSAGAEEVLSVHPDEYLERLLVSHLPDNMRSILQAGGYSYLKDDGRVFLARQARRPPAPAGAGGPAGWDLVLLNLEGPAQVNSARYYTPEFFRRSRRAFSPAGGVLALRLPMGANSPYPAQLDQAASIWASLKTCFSHLNLAVTQTHCHFFAADRPGLLSGNLDTLTARIAPFETGVPGLTRYLLPMFFDSTRTRPMREILDSRSVELATHTDTAPVAWFHHLRLWVRLARQSSPERKTGPGPVETLFDSAAAVKSGGFIVFPAMLVSLFLVLCWLLASSRGKPFRAISLAVVLSIAVSGFVAMGATVLLIYLCQLVFGALFHQVALISAIFMAALALGSYREAKRATLKAAGARVVGMLSFALSAAAVLPAAGIYLLVPLQEIPAVGTALSLIFFYFMVAAAGYCCGALFPWAAALHAAASDRARASHTAAALDFADHLGACLGAMAFGVIAVPVLGIVPAAASLALVMACPALFWSAVAAAQADRDSGKR